MKQNKNGFSIVEALIAAVILVVTALLIAKMVMNFKGTSRGLEGNLDCHTRAQAVIGAFKNLDNKTLISNFQPCPNCNPAPYASAYTNLNHPERFESNNIPLGPPATSAVTYDVTNNWLLIDNGINLALNLYNQKKLGGPDFCTAPGVQFMGTGAGPSPTPSIIATNPIIDLQGVLNQVGPALNQEKDFLQVSLYDITTSTDVACGSTSYLSPGYTLQRIIPLGAQNSSTPETKLGVKIKSTVQFVNQSGVQETCTADTALRADGNTAGPQFIWDPQYLFAAQFTNPYFFVCDYTHPYVCLGVRSPLEPSHGGQWNFINYPTTGQNPAKVYCGNSASLANVHFAVAVDEPGVSFGCYFAWNSTKQQIDSATGVSGYTPPVNSAPLGVTFQPCNGGVFTTPSGGTFTTSMTQVTLGPSPVPLPTRPAFASPSTLTVSTGSVTAAEITVNNIPDGWYTVYIRAYDSSQNQTTVAQEFGVDDTRPDKLSPTGGSYNFVPPSYVHYVSAPYPSPGLYQCQPSNNAQYWTVTSSNSASGVPNVAPSGAIWKIDGVKVGGGNCSGAALVPTTLGIGTHTVTAQPCDDCNSLTAGGPTVPAYPAISQTWKIETGPGCPTPTPAPSVSPSPSPTPTPTPFACCLAATVQCVGSGGACAWGPPISSDYYAMGYLDITIPPGGPVPNPAGPGPSPNPNYCANQPICSTPPNHSIAVCQVVNPCPVLLQPMAVCNYDYECASNSCVTRMTGPSSKECQ